MSSINLLPQHLLELRQQLEQAPMAESLWPLLEEYYSFFKPSEFQQELWQLVVAGLTNEETAATYLQTGVQRANLIFFYEFTVLVMEAMHQVHRCSGFANTP